jgi:hypothetical protein
MDAITAHEASAAEQRAAAAREALEHNKLLAQEKKSQGRRHQADEHFRNEADMSNTLSSDLMNEAVTGSAYGAHRTLPYAFKVTSQSFDIRTCHCWGCLTSIYHCVGHDS